MKEMLQDGFLTTELIGRNFLDLTIDTCLYIKAAHTRAGGVGRERRGEGEERGGRGEGRERREEEFWRAKLARKNPETEVSENRTKLFGVSKIFGFVRKRKTCFFKPGFQCVSHN